MTSCPASPGQMRVMSHKKQGDLGVAAAIAHYMNQGYVVCFPLTDTARYDLVVDKNGKLYRVEIKTTNYQLPSGNYEVTLRTKGGNTSWNGLVKTISSTDCDIVFASSPDGNYEFPASVVAGMATITLGSKQVQYKLG